MNIPKLRFKEFTDEWCNKKFDDLIDIKSNTYNPIKSNINYRCIELEHINQNSGTINGFINSNEQKSNKIFFKKGDVLFSKLRPYLRKYWLAEFDGVCSSEILVTKSKNDKLINNKFIFDIFQSNYFLQLCNLSTGSKMPRADWTFIKEQSIPIPLLNEQLKIANFLNLLDKKIELQTKKIEALKLFKKGLLDILINNMKIETITTLNKIGTYYSGLAGKSKEAFETGNQKYIPFMSVLENKIIIDNLPNVLITENEHQNKVKSGDLFFTISSETQEEVGMCSTINCVEEDLYLNSFCFGYRLNNLNKIDNEFLCYLLLSRKYRNKISKLGQGFTRVNLSKNQLLNLNVELPKIEVQIRIKNILNTLNVLFDLEVSKLNTLNKQKKGLLQNMFV